MVRKFIDKIRETIYNHLDDEKFGVTELADKMGLSRSQLLRKVKSTTGKSVNHFIREIRLEEALKRLENKELTASEVAYEVGFGSPSYFNKCFLDKYGITPGDYKKRLEGGGQKLEMRSSERSRSGGRSKLRIWGLAVVVAGVIAYLLSVKFQQNAVYEQASIAVLPLLDLSQNQDKDYLADGITEAITLELSRNESIRVISRGSPMTYKGQRRVYSEIAKELGVNLLLEGSVLFDDDSLRVVVQLIDPFPEERHLWANSYSQNTTNILQLVREVSSEIAHGISKVVEPEAKPKVAEIEPEAYDLYLRGRHLWNNQKIRKSSLLKAHDYIEESLKTDPQFAPAHVTFAEIDLAINKLIGDNEEKIVHRDHARRSIAKALELDEALPEAYITGGNLKGKFDWEWEQMKEMALQGLKLEPSNSRAHLILSNYFVVTGDYQKALKEALIAAELDPLNPETGCVVAERYYIAGEYEQAIEKYEEVLEFDPDYGFALNGLGYVFHQLGNIEKTVATWQQLQYIMKNDSLAWCYDHYSFEDCLHFYLGKAQQNTPRFCSNPAIIASVFMMVEEPAKALNYLQIAFQYQNEDLPVMLAYPDFYPLHDSAGFQEIAQQVGVSIPHKKL